MATHYAEIKCPHCGAGGRVDNDENSPFMMGRCPVCGGHVVHFCGASLALDDEIFATHSLATIADHILERIDDFLELRVLEFLEEFAEEFGIEVEIEGAKTIVPIRRPGTHFVRKLPRPSRRNLSAKPISADDARNFRRIDLDGDRINVPENWS